MATEVKLPQLGQTMEEGTIVTCLVKAGDEVKKGDVIFEIETDKATLEMESPAAGFVKVIAAEVGQTVPVGDIVMILGAKDEEVDASAYKQAEGAAAVVEAPAAEAAPKAAAAATGGAVAIPDSVNVVKLPQLGQTMEEGTIVSCLVKVGDEISRGDVIFEIETDKATLEMESPAAGCVKVVIAEVGQTVPVGDAVLALADKGVELADDVVAALKGGAAEAAVETPAVQAAAAPAADAAVAAEIPADINVVKLPQLGQTMEEGTIVSCLVKVGDEINRGDVIFEVETDKATLEMESPAGGCVAAVLAEVGQTVPVGDAVLALGGKDTVVTDDIISALKGETAAATPAAVSPEAPKAQAVAPAAAPKAARKGQKVIASPRAKKVAKELGVDLSVVAGTGPCGRIVEKDVRAAKASGATAVAAEDMIKLGDTVPVTKMQKITGERMLQSKREIPCFYLTVKADMTELVHYRAALNLEGDVKVAFNDFIIKAVAMGLEKFPVMTGQLAGNVIQTVDTVNVGLAMAVPGGLIVPVVKNIEGKTVTEVARDTKSLIAKAKSGKVLLTDLEGGCFTVSNLGGFGIDSFIPVVVPGQCCIMGVGQIADTCVPTKGGIMIRKMMAMTISVDHKVANGAYAAQFLDFVRKTLENPANFK